MTGEHEMTRDECLEILKKYDNDLYEYYCEMDDIIACAACGKLLKFGDSYTSRKILSNGGFGFAVCEDCYEKEFEK